MPHAAAKLLRGGAGTRELDSDQRDAEAGDADGSDPAYYRAAACLLAELLTMAMEIPDRVGGRTPLGVTADCPGLLYLGGDRPTQPAWAVLYESRRPFVAVHL